MEIGSDRAFNELSQEVQQQFLWYREQSSRKFQELEDLVALAAQKMELLKKREAQKSRRPRLPNSFASKQEPLDSHFTQFEEYTEQLRKPYHCL